VSFEGTESATALSRGNAFDQFPDDSLAKYSHIFGGEIVRNIGIKQYVPVRWDLLIASPQH
jgi:hypothetical protein